jgi:hypothetical protein
MLVVPDSRSLGFAKRMASQAKEGEMLSIE